MTFPIWKSIPSMTGGLEVLRSDFRKCSYLPREDFAVFSESLSPEYNALKISLTETNFPYSTNCEVDEFPLFLIKFTALISELLTLKFHY